MTTPPLRPGRVFIQLGALAPKIKQQVKDQGMRGFPPGITACLQADADAITRLKLRGFITDVAAESARKKLVKLIGVHQSAGYPK